MKYVETIILRGLLTSDDFARKVLPFLKEEYFAVAEERECFSTIRTYFDKYNIAPSKDALDIEFQGLKVNETTFNNLAALSETLTETGAQVESPEWMVDTTEQFCKDKALYNALTEAISISNQEDDNENARLSKTAIPEILQEALAISFDSNVGHDFIEDADARFAYYKEKKYKILSHLDMLNKITAGGAERKTVNCVVAGCVHPDTKIKIRIKERDSYTIKEVCISEVKDLPKSDLYVSSPDGWVGINYFVNKGKYKEYKLMVGEVCVVRCNEDHLFETPLGWLSARHIYEKLNYVPVLTDSGEFVIGSVEYTGKTIDIVDINVDHPNHRYYTNGISSHNTGAGKSMLLCDLAAGYARSGHNVLYITNEMAEEKISQRLDANFMNLDISKIDKMDKDVWDAKIARVSDLCVGKILVKEYPTSTAHVGHYRFLLKELAQKQHFVPDIIIVDYLNICASARYSDKTNSYGYIKAICEELRGLAVETNTLLWTASQVNRSGIDNSDIDLTNISECIHVDSIVNTSKGKNIKIKDVSVGDKILGSTGYVQVLDKFPIQTKQCYKITTKSGKEIICSEDHTFPTNRGRICIKNGLTVGDKLNSKGAENAK